MKHFQSFISIFYILLFSSMINKTTAFEFNQVAYDAIKPSILSKISLVTSIGNFDIKDFTFSDMTNSVVFMNSTKKSTLRFIYYLHLLVYPTIKTSKECLVPKILSFAADPSDLINNPKKYLKEYFKFLI